MDDQRLWWTDGQASLDMGLLSDYTLQRGDPDQDDMRAAESLAWDQLRHQGHNMTGRMHWEIL